jgi:hypothetical protein
MGQRGLIDTVPEGVDAALPHPQPGQMSVLAFPPRGRWAWDARGHERAVRVSAHAREGLINLSMWRDEICVGTVRLQPDEVAGLVEGLTEGLARLAERTAESPPSVSELEDRLARIESRLARPAWRTAAATAVARAGAALARADRLRTVRGQ